jgi:hypothetical protein
VRARGHFPNEAAALKCVYLAVMSLDPTEQGRKRWTMRWKPALNASRWPSKADQPQPASSPHPPGYTVFLTDPGAIDAAIGYLGEWRQRWRTAKTVSVSASVV